MNRNEAIEFLRKQSLDVFQGAPFNYSGGVQRFDWVLMKGVFVADGMTITESDVFGTESLQSRIEQLLGMKFETEEKLIETIGSLWGSAPSDIRVDNRTDCQVAHRRTPDGAIEVQVTSRGSQQKTYWDGVEPLRVGHIVQGGEVVAITDTECCVLTNNGLEIWPQRSTNAHPFAKYTSQERHFLSEQLKAGVIKLC